MAIVRKDLTELMIPEYALTELGYFTETECQRIKEIMDGKTYMDFLVRWSNCAGNCTLIVKTNYEADATEIKNFFISCFMREVIWG